jgi:glycosyltransferase involved in cell wall biosynthesis
MADVSNTEPLVSVVTPFYNTEAYLAECIESVLAQTYRNWEYVLVNNQSTDASRRVCERYAVADARIRLLDTPEHFGQVENFERALKQMSPHSKYCKMVLADDWIAPECIERMVELAEAHPTVGIVSAYRLFGSKVVGDGLPYASTVVPGREAGRIMLLHGYYLTGSPTSILVRADLVRKMDRFYPGEWIHEDTEACLRILAEHDLGFIHQVLTYSRADDDSVIGRLTGLNPGLLRKYLFAKQYGPQFLDPPELRELLRSVTSQYGHFLASSLFELKGAEFWDFHRRGLRSSGYNFQSVGLARYTLVELVDLIFNPKKTVGRLVRAIADWRGRSRQRRHPVSGASQ